MSWAILVREVARVFRAPERLHDGVVGGERLELVGRRLELGTRHLGHLLGNGFGEALEGVDARADGGAALGQQAQVRRALSTRLMPNSSWATIAAELLGEA